MNIMDFIQNCARSLDEYKAEQFNRQVEVQRANYIKDISPLVRDIFGKSLRALPNHLQPIQGDNVLENSAIRTDFLNYGLWEISVFASEQGRKSQAFCNSLKDELQLILDNQRIDAVREFHNQFDIICQNSKYDTEIVNSYVAYYKHNFHRLWKVHIRSISFKDGRFYYLIDTIDSTDSYQLSPCNIWPGLNW